MSEPRELFEPIDIIAISGIHSLLKDGKIQVIGSLMDKRRYMRGGGCIVPREVCFHFGTKHPDYFYFENWTMVYQVVSIKTPEYLTDIYAECARRKETTSEEFIELVVERHVMTELGFKE